ncbi:hypothetical protein [uncultured Amnibacterium sp.]|uniref:hypothetical protein n=1 Tax=uncultured Amnibacterium sp. TaxID=1631851 RepID=UPI0035CC6155
MTRDRLWATGLVAVIVLVLLLSVVLGVAPALKEAQANNAERASVDALNQTQSLALTSLVSDKRNMAALQTRLAKANAALPAKPQLSSLLGELNSLEHKYGVHLTGYTGGDAEKFDASASGATSTSAPATAATPAPSAAPTSTSSTSTTAAPTSASGLYSIPVQVQAAGDYADLVDFVGGLQTGKRLFVVKTLTIGTGSASGAFSATVNGYVYLLTDGTTPVTK